jgi:alpha-beta hydrolase superfamily lysophospholipase
MKSSSFRFSTHGGPQVFVRVWLPEITQPRANVLIAHGAAEHSLRYERLAAVLTSRQYAVYAPDHRGHKETAGYSTVAGNAGPDGFNGMIRDLGALAERIQQEHPSTPLFLLGHSMGAALLQRLVQIQGASLIARGLRGLILSGSPGLRPNLEQGARGTAQAAMGAAAEQPSEFFQKVFTSYNQGFEPGNTGSEWLSRDQAEVQKYADDPWCGFPFTNRLVAEMSQCAFEAGQHENIASIPKSLPIWLFSGTQDRVSANGEYVNALALAYRDSGISDVRVTLYPDGRHEMLNEINRDQVHSDLVAWLNERTN